MLNIHHHLQILQDSFLTIIFSCKTLSSPPVVTPKFDFPSLCHAFPSSQNVLSETLSPPLVFQQISQYASTLPWDSHAFSLQPKERVFSLLMAFEQMDDDSPKALLSRPGDYGFRELRCFLPSSQPWALPFRISTILKPRASSWPVSTCRQVAHCKVPTGHQESNRCVCEYLVSKERSMTRFPSGDERAPREEWVKRKESRFLLNSYCVCQVLC